MMMAVTDFFGWPIQLPAFARRGAFFSPLYTISMSAGGGGGGGGGGKTIGDVVGERLLSMLEQKEEELDQQLHQIDNLEEDEVERMRAQRMEVLKRNQKQKAEWLAQGHGEYREVEDQ